MKPCVCLFCGRPTVPWLASPVDPKTGRTTPYGSAMICNVCGIGAVHPHPSAAEIQTFYDLDNYYTHNRSHFKKATATIADRILVKLAWQLDRGHQVNLDKILDKLSSPGSVCDLGCGSGEFLIGLMENGWSAKGVEPDAN